jgi:hypothetical protein
MRRFLDTFRGYVQDTDLSGNVDPVGDKTLRVIVCGTLILRRIEFMTYLFCKHRVAEYARWRRVFDSHAKAQRED